MSRAHPAILALMVILAACAAPTAAPPERPSASSAWDRTVDDAKREGTVVILGPPGADVRDALVEPFQKRYPEIQVDYTAPATPELVPKLLQERAAGLYRIDLIISGAGPFILNLRPEGALDPIRPFLAGPDIGEGPRWLEGKLDFADDDEVYALVFSTNVSPPSPTTRSSSHPLS